MAEYPNLGLDFPNPEDSFFLSIREESRLRVIRITEERTLMKIEQLMTKVTRTCRSDQSLSEVAHTMWVHDCGCLPVTAEDGSERLLGIITDRDICMVICSGKEPPGGFCAADAMTELVRACNPGDPVSEAIAIMGEARVRRLPVVDDSDRVIGLLSLADLALEAARQATMEKPVISMSEVGALLAAICQPRHVLTL
jgi:CBS domain-containing protein